MKKLNLLFLALVGFTLASCSTDGDDTINGVAYLENFNVVRDLTSQSVVFTTGTNYSMNYNITQGTAVVVIDNLKTSADGEYIDITLNDIKWTGNKDGWRVIQGSNFVANGHTIDQLDLRMLPRTQPYGGPVYSISFRLDNRYDIRVLPTEINYYSTTITTPGEGVQGTSFVSRTAEYLVGLHPETGKADILFKGAQFAPTMPAFNFVINDLKFAVTNDGFDITQTADTVIPADVNNTPMPGFPITGLKLEADLTDDADLEMTVKAANFGIYNVEGDLDYVPSIILL